MFLDGLTLVSAIFWLGERFRSSVTATLGQRIKPPIFKVVSGSLIGSWLPESARSAVGVSGPSASLYFFGAGKSFLWRWEERDFHIITINQSSSSAFFLYDSTMIGQPRLATLHEPHTYILYFSRKSLAFGTPCQKPAQIPAERL